MSVLTVLVLIIVQQAAADFGSVAVMAANVHPCRDAVAHDVGSYTIRYRCRNDRGIVALIVTDDRGVAYLFSGGVLQIRCSWCGCRNTSRRAAPWPRLVTRAVSGTVGLQCLLSA